MGLTKRCLINVFIAGMNSSIDSSRSVVKRTRPGHADHLVSGGVSIAVRGTLSSLGVSSQLRFRLRFQRDPWMVEPQP